MAACVQSHKLGTHSGALKVTLSPQGLPQLLWVVIGLTLDACGKPTRSSRAGCTSTLLVGTASSAWCITQPVWVLFCCSAAEVHGTSSS
jgi:hypothetical protein